MLLRGYIRVHTVTLQSRGEIIADVLFLHPEARHYSRNGVQMKLDSPMRPLPSFPASQRAADNGSLHEHDISYH